MHWKELKEEIHGEMLLCYLLKPKTIFYVLILLKCKFWLLNFLIITISLHVVLSLAILRTGDQTVHCIVNCSLHPGIILDIRYPK